MGRLKNNNFNGQEIIGMLSMNLGSPKTTTDLIITSFFKNILKIAKEGGKVKIDGFGTFEPVLRNSKKKAPRYTIRFMPSIICEKELNVVMETKGEV